MATATAAVLSSVIARAPIAAAGKSAAKIKVRVPFEEAQAVSLTGPAAEIAGRYQALTQEAIERKVFGAPTYVYRDELFWGQDRLDFLDRALAK